MSKFLNITSNDRDPSSVSASDFIINVQNNNVIENVKEVIVHSISVPNFFYNVRDGSNGPQNNTLNILETTQAPTIVTIPQGQYDINEYITVLQAQLNASLVGSVATVTILPYTYLLNIVFVGNSVILYNNADGSTMGGVMGLTTTTTALNNITMNQTTNLNGIQIVYLHSQEIANTNAIDAGKGYISVIDSISFHDTGYGEYAYVRNEDNVLSSIKYNVPRSLTFVSIKLRDESGNILTIPNDQKITIVLKIFY